MQHWTRLAVYMHVSKWLWCMQISIAGIAHSSLAWATRRWVLTWEQAAATYPLLLNVTLELVVDLVACGGCE